MNEQFLTVENVREILSHRDIDDFGSSLEQNEFVLKQLLKQGLGEWDENVYWRVDNLVDEVYLIDRDEGINPDN